MKICYNDVLMQLVVKYNVFYKIYNIYFKRSVGSKNSEDFNLLANCD